MGWLSGWLRCFGWLGCFGLVVWLQNLMGCLVVWFGCFGCLVTELDEVFCLVVWFGCLVTELELPYSNHSTIESGRANI
jgi:hypothetical protein